MQSIQSELKLPELRLPAFQIPKLSEGTLSLINKSKASSQKTINKKLKVLTQLGFANSKDSPHLSRTPVICVADFVGKKESFLKQAGFLQDYLQLKKEEKSPRIRSSSKLLMPDKPYIMDMKTERKVLYEEQKRKSACLSPITLSPCGIKKKKSDLEELMITLERKVDKSKLDSNSLNVWDSGNVKMRKSCGDLLNFRENYNN